MAAKKPGKGGKSTPKKAQPATPEPATDAASKALLAVSTPASADDVKKETILACIVSVFDAQGLNHIKDQQAKIVWSTIDDAVIVALGRGITDCIDSKGFECTPLAAAFLNLKGQVTVVSDLISGIAVVVTP